MQPTNNPPNHGWENGHRLIPAVIVIGIGVLFLLNNLNILYFSEWARYWPLFLIGAGLLMLFRGDSWHRVRPGLYVHGRMREASVFGGGKRQINTQDFTGGHIDAVFSGYEIDLRGAIMTGDSATLKVSAVFSGVEIRVPETWSVVIDGHGVFGAFVDNTVQPNPQTPGLKRLFVKGDAVFGGVDVKN
jgi:hypothetical protein